jgi:hypothetical protein
MPDVETRMDKTYVKMHLLLALLKTLFGSAYTVEVMSLQVSIKLYLNGMPLTVLIDQTRSDRSGSGARIDFCRRQISLFILLRKAIKANNSKAEQESVQTSR